MNININSNSTFLKKSKELLLYSILIYKLKNIDSLSIDEMNNDHVNNYEINNLIKYIEENEKILLNYICPKTHIHIFIIKNKKNKEIKIIFKGTTNIHNTFYNMQFHLKSIDFLDNSDIKIHNGFYQNLFKGKIYQLIIKTLNNQNLKDYIIYVSGHSLGGSLSILFGFLSSYVYNNKFIIITFGSSKVGNNVFKQKFNKINNLLCYNYYNSYDYIFHLPLIHYKHVGNIIKLKQKNGDSKINFLKNHCYNFYFKNFLFTYSNNI